jgi:mono/diheme cytochrome c family protein
VLTAFDLSEEAADGADSDADDDAGRIGRGRAGGPAMRRAAGLLWTAVLAAVLLAPAPAAAQESKPLLVARGARTFQAQGCYGCHMIGKAGTPIGPDLSRVGFKYDEGYLRRWLADPQEQRPTAHMPKLELTPQEIEALAAFLAIQR